MKRTCNSLHDPNGLHVPPTTLTFVPRVPHINIIKNKQCPFIYQTMCHLSCNRILRLDFVIWKNVPRIMPMLFKIPPHVSFVLINVMYMWIKVTTQSP